MLLLAVVLCLTPALGNALSPVTPKLDQASQRQLVSALGRTGIDDVASSAVLNALLAVLGPTPASRRFHYAQPYPQLPDVDAETTPAGMGCSEVDLVAHPKAATARAVTVHGTYCLSDATEMVWSAREVSVRAR